MGGRQACGGSVMLWAMFCWETLGPGIHVDVTLICTTYLNIVADQVHPFMATVFPHGSELFQQDNAPLHFSGMVWVTSQRVLGVALASKFPRSQANWASVGCAGKASPTSQLTGLKGSAANVLVPDTRGHLQRSFEVHASMDQSYFGGMMGTYTILGKWF